MTQLPDPEFFNAIITATTLVPADEAMISIDGTSGVELCRVYGSAQGRAEARRPISVKIRTIARSSAHLSKLVVRTYELASNPEGGRRGEPKWRLLFTGERRPVDPDELEAQPT
jgi:hypothetical protein